MRRFVCLSGAVLLMALGACGEGGTPGSEAAGPDAAPSLVDGAFISTEVMANGETRALVAGTRIELTAYATGRLRWRAGCNQYDAAAYLDGDTLVVGESAGTTTGCDAALHEQDTWFANFLSGRPVWRLSGTDLTLTGSATVVRLVSRDVMDPDRALIGTRWTVDTIIAGETARSVPVDTEAYLTFAADGGVTGSSGCNSFGGRAAVAGNTITITDLVSTRMACADQRADLEEAVLQVFNQPMTYTIEARTLALAAPGGIGLRLTTAG